MKVVFYGVGKYYERIIQLNDMRKYQVVAYIDENKSGLEVENKRTISLEEFMASNIDYDYIIVTSIEQRKVRQILIDNNIDKNKIITNGIIHHNNIDTAIEFSKCKVDKPTIICNTCVGAVIYNCLECEYLSPFMNLYIPEKDFVRMLKDLKYYMSIVEKMNVYFDSEKKYPIGDLEGIKILFKHDTSCEIAYKNFVKRSKRINWENICVIYRSNDEKAIEEFLKLDYRKLLVTKLDYKNENIYICKDNSEYEENKVYNLESWHIPVRFLVKYYDVRKIIGAKIR